MMSQGESQDEDDTEVVTLESGKHTLSKKARVEPSLDDEKVNLRRTIPDLRLAKAESEQVRLKFVFDMQDIQKQQEELQKSQQEGVALLQ